MLAVGLIAATGVALATLPRHASDPAKPAPQGAADMQASATDVAVVDGGTLRLGNQVVRLLGVDPPPRGTPCSSGTGEAADCGVDAANALAALVRQSPVTCHLTSVDRMGRPYAICEARSEELNHAVIAEGWARADADAQPELKQAEVTARADHRGVWATADGANW